MAFAHAQLVPRGSREIRVGSDAWVYGDRYDWCCVAKPIGEGTVELSLVTSPPTRRQAWAVVRLLRSLGYRQILVRRVTDGRERVVQHVWRPRTAPWFATERRRKLKSARGLLMRSQKISLTDRESPS